MNVTKNEMKTHRKDVVEVIRAGRLIDRQKRLHIRKESIRILVLSHRSRIVYEERKKAVVAVVRNCVKMDKYESRRRTW